MRGFFATKRPMALVLQGVWNEDAAEADARTSEGRPSLSSFTEMIDL
jgi:hypothetical protein